MDNPYERLAHEWNDDRGPTLSVERKWIDKFLALVREGGTILDVGCGSGEPIAGHLIRNGFKVVGIDSSPSLLAIARERHPESEWLLQDMRSLGLGRRFDGLIAWDSFFHLRPDEQRSMIARFAAHLQPGAPLLITTGPRAGEVFGMLRHERMYHASLDPDEYRALFTSAGFVVNAHVAEDADAGDHTVWLATCHPGSDPSRDV